MKIWIDVTDLKDWSGHLTGTQRVTYQLARSYAQNCPEADFFIYNPSAHTFHAFDFIDLDKRVNSHASKPAESDLALPTPRLSRQILNRMSSHLRPLARRYLSHETRRLLIGSIRKSQEIVSRHRHQKQSISQAKLRPRIGFMAEDVVLLIGKPWDYPDMVNDIKIAKLSTGFKLHCLIYDILAIYRPHLFNQQFMELYTKVMFEIASNSDGLFAISNNTRKDMLRFCKDLLIPPPPIRVIRLGDELETVSEPVEPSGPKLSKDSFILSVSTIEVRKNHALLYYAWKEGIARGIAMPKLVIVGGKHGWYTQDIQHLFNNDPELIDKVFILDHTTDAELAWLYQNCMFTIFPSVYEGWGLPVAESLAYGKLCISSNVSSMPEIAGDLIDYFSPFDSGACLEKIVEYSKKTKRLQKERLIRSDYKPTSWEQTYRQFHNTIEKTLSETRLQG